MGLLNDKLRAYRAILKKQMQAAHWYQIPVWAPMIGHIGGTEGKYPRSVPYGAAKRRTLRPTFKPIEVLTDFMHMGGWEMDIPVAYPYTEQPVYGDNPALGKEEKRKFAYNRAIINQVRKPVLTRDGIMGEHALDAKMVADIMKNAKEELTDYNIRWQGYAPYDAAYRGYSQNILAAKADGGFGHVLSQKSHPNFYVAGYGLATWSDTAATYETNVNTALDTLDSSSGLFNTRVIENAKLFAGRHRISATNIGGKKVIGIMIINDAQAHQLFQDTKFINAHQDLTSNKGEESALFTGSVEAYLYRGVIIIVDQNNPGVWTSGDSSYDSTRGTINYGNSNPLDNPIMASDRKLALFVGASAIMCGHAVPLGFESETWDYKNKKSEASYTVVGYNRSDIYDNDGFFGTAGNFKENTSSLVIATYSPNSPTWSDSEES